MTKIIFKDLPDRSTPRNAENLNKLNNLAIDTTVEGHDEEVVLIKGENQKSEIYANGEKYTDTVNIGTEPNNSGLWVEKSNNLLNLYDVIFSSEYHDGSYIINDYNNINMDFSGDWARKNFTIKGLKPNTQYFLSANVKSSGTQAGFYNSTTKEGSLTTSEKICGVVFTSDSTGTITGQFYFNYSATSTSGTIIYNDIQLVEGDIRISYKPYVTPSIKVNGKTEFTKNVYSESEVVIGEYLGKPLYRKVVDCGSLPNTAQKSISHNISNIEKITNLYGIAKQEDVEFTLPFISTISNECIALYRIGNDIIINAGRNRSGMTGYVTIEYTKTTD